MIAEGAIVLAEESISSRLAFGESCASIEHDPDIVAQKFGRYHPRLDSFEVKGDQRAFISKYSTVLLPDLTAIAFHRSPVLIERVDIPDFTLWLPTFGTATLRSGRQIISVGRGIGFGLDTSRHRIIENDSVGGVLFKLDRPRLSKVMETMAGSSVDTRHWWDREELRLLAFDNNRFPFMLFCDAMLGVLDTIAMNPALAQRLPVGDQFYRMVAMLLGSTFGAETSGKRRGDASRREIERLCDFIDAKLMDPLTLTQLEAESGLSARVLQMQFRKHFGLTPMEWVRNRRLDLARTRLLADPTLMITSLSYELGFSSPSHFAAYYQRRFGELPSRVRSRKDLMD